VLKQTFRRVRWWLKIQLMSPRKFGDWFVSRLMCNEPAGNAGWKNSSRELELEGPL
jgi:hypothetical protein